MTCSSNYNPIRGVLTVEVEGMWTLADANRFGERADMEYPMARLHGPLRLLLDNTEACVFPQDVLGRLAEIGNKLACPDDRVAVLVGSSLMKLQMKRLMPPGLENVFVSRNAAITWLTAHDHGRPDIAA